MKPHYFHQDKADSDDYRLQIVIDQGYVPRTCLLGGALVMGLINNMKDPCEECDGPREICHGKEKSNESNSTT